VLDNCIIVNVNCREEKANKKSYISDINIFLTIFAPHKGEKVLIKMSNLKSLFKDTVIYGMSSILGRFLNYLLVPIYTHKMAASSGDYGVITNVYAYTALLLVILTFGMETTFFRYVNKSEKPMQVYSTVLIMVGTVCALFAASTFAFIHPLAAFMGYTDHPEYVWTMFLCVSIDSFQCIPFAYLRYKHRPIKFASLKVLFIAMNVILNLVYFILIPVMYNHHIAYGFISLFYHGTVSVAYAFYINLFCTFSVTFFMRKELTGFKYVFDKHLARQMWHYSWPILILGIAGILNQTADKIIFPFVSTHVGKEINVQLGIYGACVKIAMIMTLITQAFRYAYEPFVFGNSKDKDSKETYAAAMKYFIIFTLFAFLIVMGYMDILKRLIIARDYWAGLKVTPIVMVAGILLGIYFNLSLWYKLVDKTIYGMWFSLIGCISLIAVNVIFIPRFSYMACAWGGVVGYGIATILSYFVGQKYFPINYPLKDIAKYALLTAILYIAITKVPDHWNLWVKVGIKTCILLVYLAYTVKKDVPSFLSKKKATSN